MPYYVRVLSRSDEPIPLSRLRAALEAAKLVGELRCDVGTEAEWESIILSHADGSEIALIERNPVAADSFGAGDLEAFLKDVDSDRPASAVAWLKDYFKRVRCVYAFQVLRGVYYSNGCHILGWRLGDVASYDSLWSRFRTPAARRPSGVHPGICLQSDVRERMRSRNVG